MKRFIISAWCAIAFLTALALGTAFLSIYAPPDTGDGFRILVGVAGLSGVFAFALALIMIFVTLFVLMGDSDE